MVWSVRCAASPWAPERMREEAFFFETSSDESWSWASAAASSETVEVFDKKEGCEEERCLQTCDEVRERLGVLLNKRAVQGRGVLAPKELSNLLFQH